MKKVEPIKDDLIANFTYANGFLFWKTKPVKGYKTTRGAGSVEANGYSRMSFRDTRYMTHRLIWIFHNGEIPSGYQINHIDCNRSNNRIENLELVTPRENLQRTSHHKTGRLFGCYFHKKNRKWRANIQKNGKLYLIGEFSTEIEAHIAYKKEAELIKALHNIPNNH